MYFYSKVLNIAFPSENTLFIKSLIIRKPRFIVFYLELDACINVYNIGFKIILKLIVIQLIVSIKHLKN